MGFKIATFLKESYFTIDDFQPILIKIGDFKNFFTEFILRIFRKVKQRSS